MPIPNNVVSFTVDIGTDRPCIVNVSGIIKEITPDFIKFTTGSKYARSAINSPIKQFYARNGHVQNGAL
jgi:hypothetical protein